VISLSVILSVFTTMERSRKRAKGYVLYRETPEQTGKNREAYSEGAVPFVPVTK
jgi:hypothetical protein